MSRPGSVQRHFEDQAGHPFVSMSHLRWTCPKCGASGTIDLANPVDIAIAAMLETHLLLSPECPTIAASCNVCLGPKDACDCMPKIRGGAR